MYGYAPLSWDLPDGRTIVVDVDELQLPPLARAAEATFTVGYRDAPGHAVRCSSGLAPGAEGWFRCWGVDARDQPIHFDLGAGNDCELSVARHIDTYTTPACWKGRARVAGTEIQLDRGYFERSGMIVGYASWVDGTQPLFAANIVGEQQIQLHDGPSALHPADADLLLLTVALHWFEQATDQ